MVFTTVAKFVDEGQSWSIRVSSHIWDSDGTEPASYYDVNPKCKVEQVEILNSLQITSEVLNYHCC